MKLINKEEEEEEKDDYNNGDAIICKGDGRHIKCNTTSLCRLSISTPA